MLDTMRKGAHSLFSKLLLGTLILSFAVWGIGDIITGPPSNAVAVVGDISITASRYDRALQRVRRSFGNNYSSELFAQLNVPQQVLSALVNNALLFQEADELGVRISDELLAEHIRTNPDFINNSGEFDRQLFSLMLRDNRLSESTYLNFLREELSIDLLESVITNIPLVSEPLVRRIYLTEGERRVVQLGLVTNRNVGELPKPSDEELQELYEKQQPLYRTPEYRAFEYVVIEPEAIINSVNVSNDELKSSYEANKDLYASPESRSVAQWLFATYDDAATAQALLDENGVSSPAKAPVAHGTYSDLGDVTLGDLPESAEEIVFNSAAGSVTEPINTSFGWHVFIIRSINAPTVKAFDEVKDTLEKELLQSKRAKALNDFTVTIEDAVAGGSSLQEIAKKYSSRVGTIAPVSRSLERQGSSGAMKPSDVEAQILAKHYDDEKDLISNLEVGPNQVYFLTKVTQVIESQPKAFDAVRGEVTESWNALKRQELKVQKASEIAEKANASDAPADVLRLSQLSLITSKPLARNDESISIQDSSKKINTTNGFVKELFDDKEINDSTGAYPLPDGDFAIGVVKKIIPAKPFENAKKAELDALRQRLAKEYRIELLDQYLHYLRAKYPVTINESLLQEIAR